RKSRGTLPRIPLEMYLRGQRGSFHFRGEHGFRRFVGISYSVNAADWADSVTVLGEASKCTSRDEKSDGRRRLAGISQRPNKGRPWQLSVFCRTDRPYVSILYKGGAMLTS